MIIINMVNLVKLNKNKQPFVSKLAINETFKNLFFETINEEFPANKYRSKNSYVYEDEVFLELILYRFAFLTSWNALTVFYKAPFNGPSSSSVFKKFSCWRENNIFFKIWKKYLINDFLSDIIKNKVNFPTINNDDDYFDLLNKHVAENNLDILELFIDSVNVFNINGTCEVINKNKIMIKKGDCSCIPQYTKKKGIKLAVVSTINKIPLVVMPHIAKKAEIHTIKPALDKLVELFPSLKNKSKYLIGDKGYISTIQNKKIIKEENNTILLTPARRNQKRQNTEIEKKRLKNRYTVENTIANIKNNLNLKYLNCRKLDNYMSFIYIKLFSGLLNSSREKLFSFRK